MNQQPSRRVIRRCTAALAITLLLLNLASVGFIRFRGREEGSPPPVSAGKGVREFPELNH